MKKITRASLWLLSVLLLTVVTVFTMNATDEDLNENTKEKLKPLVAQNGFPMKGFKPGKNGFPPAVRFNNYDEYKKEPAKWDQTLAENKKHVAPILEAIAIGHVEVNPEAKYNDGFTIYKRDAHALFLVFISQKIKQGQKAEAYALLEKSNAFLKNILETPQSLINHMLAILSLQENAHFAQSLKQEDLKIPSSLKASFKVSKTADEIFTLGSQYEFLMTSTAIEDVRKYGPELTNISDSTPSMMDRFTNFWGGKLFRPKQTLNWIAELHSEFLTDTCKAKPLDECSQKYTPITQPKGFAALINPVGRSYVSMFISRYTAVYKKLDYGLSELNKALAEI